MASVALLVGGALVNALAFSGSNYLLSKLDKGDTAEEQKRHDKAVEQLQSAQAEWSQKRTERLDWINKKLREQHQAVQDFHDADAAWREYTRFTGETLDPQFPCPSFPTFIHLVAPKKTAKLSSSSWGWP